MQADGPYISICPTFNPRSNGNLAEIADKIVHDQSPSHAAAGGDKSKSDSNSDFTFAFPLDTTNSVPPSPIPADQIFQNGRIRPLYSADDHAINKDSDSNLDWDSDSDSYSHSNDENEIRNPEAPRRNPLRKLFIKERKLRPTAVSLDSSLEKHIAKELPKQMHCDFPRPAAAEEEARSRRSIFGGNNPRRWRIVGFLNRIHPGHHGERGNFAFLTHSNSERKEAEKKPKDLPPVSRKSKSEQLTPLEP